MNCLSYKFLTLFFLPIYILYCRPVVVNGGQVTINGAVTQTQIDITLNYTANVQWLAIIFAKDQVNTDLHLLIKDTANTARPVQVKDCYLDQNSYIVYDNVDNIRPSTTLYWGDISNGLKVAYSRDLNTNDLQDKQFYGNSVIQICFMSSLQAFVGGGFQSRNQKICTFFSLHSTFSYYQDRLLGNWAATTFFGGSNLTVYATQSTDQATFQPWLFLGIVHKQQGLTPYNGRWIGITYQNSIVSTDLTVIQYGYRNFLYQLNMLDMYITNATYADLDLNYVVEQGGNDIYENLGGVLDGAYTVALYKRKFRTGDNNRDKNITAGPNQFCFLLGHTWAYVNFTYADRTCLNLSINTSYYSNFRVAQQSSGSTVIDYVEPANTVVIVKGTSRLYLFLTVMVIFLIALF